MRMSQGLYDALVEYHRQAYGIVVMEGWRLRVFGICNFLLRFREADTLALELEGLFEAQGLLSNFPFGEDNYSARKEANTQHLCPIRRAWVERIIAEAEITQDV